MAKTDEVKPAETAEPKLGKLKAGFWRVKVLRNHDGADAFYTAGQIADVWGPYAASQITGKTADGHSYTVTPAVFEVIEKG